VRLIQFGPETCGDLEAALGREWLETNGLGGYASSTIIGLHTRRYHGLLVAATQPPVGRLVLLSKFEDVLVIDGQSFDLSANQYPGVIHPAGYRYLKQFRLDPFPILVYEVEDITIEKSIFMIQGENSTVVEYAIRQAPTARRKAELLLLPLTAFRDYHSCTHLNPALNPEVQSQTELASFSPYPGMPTLHLAHNAVELRAGGGWYRDFEYAAERERGLDYREDLFNPCTLLFELKGDKPAVVIASTEVRTVAQARQHREAEVARRREAIVSSPVSDDFARTLSAASDQYIVSRADKRTVIAGYHWFGDWGRDTMIALPGLTLVDGRHDVARSILRTFADHVDKGMLPNRFPDEGEQPEYNTADATLWFFEAIRKYLEYTADEEFVRRDLYSVLADIIAWHLRGTRYGIKVDASGLLRCGEPGVQVTWMDAKVGDWVVTPRIGQAVEIQALWYNALRVMEDLAQKFGDEAGETSYRALATATRWSFNRAFWNEKTGCLFDVIDGETRDASMRPNQVLAVSLPHSMLTEDRAKSVVAKVQEHLLTPYGLRTLAPSDSNYHGQYTGDQRSRDSAYHQGTVWPWLMGPFLTAYIKVNGGSAAARDQAELWLEHLRNHLSEAGLGHVSEIFEGDAPHRPVGCIAQAWSVAELLRVYAEDVRRVRLPLAKAKQPDGSAPAGSIAPPATGS
jgi:predicted glycogen debranching enzyme